MKLCTNAFDALSREEWRALTAVELGMKDHEYVPLSVIERRAHIRGGNVAKSVQSLLRHKLVSHTRNKCDGYKVEYRGYDYLALRALARGGLSLRVEAMIGRGKESDVYLVRGFDAKLLVLKLGRLGRTSFKRVKDTRDYIEGRQHYNWLYLSRLAAKREYRYLCALYERGFPVPTPVQSNRHAIVMSFVNGFPLYAVRELSAPITLYNEAIDLIERFAAHGLVHGDFNEFNLLLDERNKLFVIDFPQIVSVGHCDAARLFARDVGGVNDFFQRKFQFVSTRAPLLADVPCVERADCELETADAQLVC